MAAKKGTAARPSVADGHKLFAQMVRELAQHWDDREEGVPDRAIPSLWKKDNCAIVKRYMASVTADDKIAHGFYQAMTDILGALESGWDTNLSKYEEGVRRA